MEKTNSKNIFQKLAAFRNNLIEAHGKGQQKLAAEQNVILYYKDDVTEVAGRVYYRCTVSFADIDGNGVIEASSFSPIGIMRARGNALKALVNSAVEDPASNANTGTGDGITNDDAVSPTPARTPSEPSGGVPKGFRGFPKA